MDLRDAVRRYLRRADELDAQARRREIGWYTYWAVMDDITAELVRHMKQRKEST